MSHSQPLSKQAAIDALWRQGVLHWKLHSAQKELYHAIRGSEKKISVIGCSRQWGKTFLLVTIAFEECLKNKNIIIKFLAPQTKDIRRIVGPIVKQIIEDCPRDLVPKFHLQDNIWRFPNGSEIQLAGTDNGNAESIRGNKAHMCIVDEAGFCDDLKYIVNSILLPTTSRTKGKIVLISTPSRSSDHEFMDFFRKAEADGTLIKKTIFDNPQLTEKDITDLMEAAGGRESVNFRREYLVENITSEEDAVVPEFTQELREKIVKEVPRPSHFDSYVSMDIGGRDFTAVLFAYYDFKNARIVIEDEYIGSDVVLTDEIAKNIIEKERYLWTDQWGEPKPPLLRVADNNNIILLNDLAYKHKIYFTPTLKDNKDAAINNMRMLIKSQQIYIHPRCKVLIHHLSNAIWNKAKTSYARDAGNGHYDFCDALSYLCRNINFTKNPYPDNFKYSVDEFKPNISVEKNLPVTNVEIQLNKLFKYPNRRLLGRK